MVFLDSFLNKRIGPVFLKETSDAEEFIKKMNSLLANASGDPALIGGISDNMSGESKIIFKTGAVQAR